MFFYRNNTSWKFGAKEISGGAKVREHHSLAEPQLRHVGTVDFESFVLRHEFLGYDSGHTMEEAEEIAREPYMQWYKRPPCAC